MFSPVFISLLCLIYFCNVSQAWTAPKWDLLSAPWTPFKKDFNETIDFSKVAKQAELHAKLGVTTVWAVGGMGQWASLERWERLKLAEEWVHHGKKHGLRVLIHVGSQSLREAEFLAAHAQSIGADGIAVIPPFAPQRPGTMEVLIAMLGRIAQAANKLPFYYYHIPGTTNIRYKMAEFIPKAAAVIPTFEGIKYVENDLEDFEKCVAMRHPHTEKPYELWWAPNPKLQAMPFGAKGFTLAEGYLASFVREMAEAYSENEMEKSKAASDYVDAVYKATSKGNGRSVMKMLGCDLGPPRLPAISITSAQYDEEYEALEAIDFFKKLPPYQ